MNVIYAVHELQFLISPQCRR